MSGEPKHREPDDLSIPEKILRVQDLWDEIARTPADVEITPLQREEVERRLSRARCSPGEVLFVARSEATAGGRAVSRVVWLLPEAEREVEVAFSWYESQRKGLGFEFLLAFDAAIENRLVTA